MTIRATFLIKECGHYSYPSPKVFEQMLYLNICHIEKILVAVIVATVAGNIYFGSHHGHTV